MMNIHSKDIVWAVSRSLIDVDVADSMVSGIKKLYRPPSMGGFYSHLRIEDEYVDISRNDFILSKIEDIASGACIISKIQESVQEIYEMCDYPEILSPFIGYMPCSDGGLYSDNDDAMLNNIRKFLNAKSYNYIPTTLSGW